jgi:RimJ/RimL family protein N-acetyltransferase
MQPFAPIETSRLIGRVPTDSDFELYRLLYQDAAIAATLGGVRPDKEIYQVLADNVDHWRRFGFGKSIWNLKADGRFVGIAGLRQVVVEGQDEVEIGYAIMPEFWRQGFATEIALACANAAFTTFGLQELVAFTLPTNSASRRVMEKCGFDFERDIIWKDLPHVLYCLKR